MNQLFLSALLFLLLKNKISFGYIHTSFEPKSPYVAALNCSRTHPNLFFDLQNKKWEYHLYSVCITSDLDILMLCQRVYPQLNIKNIKKFEFKVKFTINNCKSDDTSSSLSMCSDVKSEYNYPYECLYGNLQPNMEFKLHNCDFHQFSDKNKCKTKENLRSISQEKCKSVGKYLNSTHYSKSCDNQNGNVFTYKQIEFSCCEKTDMNKVFSIRNEEDDSEDSNLDSKSEDKVQEVSKKSESSHEFSGAKNAIIFIGLIIVSMAIVVFFYKKLNYIKKRSANQLSSTVSQHYQDNEQINIMQIKGYENPTYKLFEKNMI